MRNSTSRKSYQSPSVQILLFRAEDIITTSGGFAGDWDENMPATIDLPKIDF